MGVTHITCAGWVDGGTDVGCVDGQTTCTGMGDVRGVVARRIIPLTNMRQRLSCGQRLSVAVHVPAVWLGSVTIPQPKHSPEPRRAVPGLRG